MFAIRMFAATFRGRLKEASELGTDFQARSVALSRSQQAGNVLMQIAIGEALFGLDEQARARVAKAEDDGILGDSTADERLVVAAILADAPAARALLPKALEEQRKSTPTVPEGTSDGERAMKALVALAEKKPAEAVTLLEPVPFDVQHTELVNLWAIAKMLSGDLPGAAKGLTFLTSQTRGGLNATIPYAYAMLARVQAQMGQKDEARKNYQKLFEIWKDADPDLPLLVEARAEYGKLGS
jgi:tetratricopeptide (TPR) repeat protein